MLKPENLNKSHPDALMTGKGQTPAKTLLKAQALGFCKAFRGSLNFNRQYITLNWLEMRFGGKIPKQCSFCNAS